jgi:hypothetical protein
MQPALMFSGWQQKLRLGRQMERALPLKRNRYNAV